MQHLEVSGAVRPLKWPLGVKWLKLLHVFVACFLQFRSDYVQTRYRRFPQKRIQQLRISRKSERRKPKTFSWWSSKSHPRVHRATAWHSVSKERLSASRNATPPPNCSRPTASNGCLNCCPGFCPDTRAQNRLPGHCLLFLLHES